MPRLHMHVTDAAEAPLRVALHELRGKLEIPDHFPPTAQAEAESAARAPRIPAADGAVATEHTLEDATDLPLFTLDPPGSLDLDQAMFLSRRPAPPGSKARGGYRVHYAIADVASFVTPGGALDAEAHHRVTTLYFPDERVPLHPYVLSEGAASLLPDRDRPAVLWQLDLDADGALTSTSVRRALVRSRAKLDYAGVQRILDDRTAEEPLALLREIGQLREEREVARGAISLNVPEQEIVEHDGRYTLEYRAPLPAYAWNAQISLLTGIAAAELMLASGTGILRTLPTAPDGSVARLRLTARALGVDWPHHTSYAALIRTLDPRRATHAAFLQECTALLRGAGYTVFDGTAPAASDALHAAVAAPYAHATAPLRRLVDRYTSELCLAASAGAAPPDWVRTALPALPREMELGTQRANQVERACVDLVEAALLRDRVGEIFEALVVEIQEKDPTHGTVHLYDPAVIGTVETAPEGPALPLGHRIPVRLTEAEPGHHPVRFTPA
ncbi:RNB domain-containing ribonuclease [Streptomyces platensis]|uniref:RNB domain-containing ribonuclease n=1 Tax=Streptomyces platensis TaxID=58346 RepID=UPI002E137E88|nr:RNB domain-containing ribonuclease [Streptomyces platensis]WSI58024.1 RNB domain-containing ribonuclease [Streptomyces platensis]WTI51912.1 RNB domain-containing ribonuclease [Streptomyces platensis]